MATLGGLGSKADTSFQRIKLPQNKRNSINDTTSLLSFYRVPRFLLKSFGLLCSTYVLFHLSQKVSTLIFHFEWGSSCAFGKLCSSFIPTFTASALTFWLTKKETFWWEVTRPQGKVWWTGTIWPSKLTGKQRKSFGETPTANPGDSIQSKL